MKFAGENTKNQTASLALSIGVLCMPKCPACFSGILAVVGLFHGSSGNFLFKAIPFAAAIFGIWMAIIWWNSVRPLNTILALAASALILVGTFFTMAFCVNSGCLILAALTSTCLIRGIRRSQTKECCPETFGTASPVEVES